jgi:transposase
MARPMLSDELWSRLKEIMLRHRIGHWTVSEYGGVSQRWLLVKSNQAKLREEHILNKAITKSTESSLKRFNRLCCKTFSCEADAQKAIEEWQKEQEFATVSEVAIIEEKHHAKPGRPNLDATYTSQFCITGFVSTSLALKAHRLHSKQLFL